MHIKCCTNMKKICTRKISQNFPRIFYGHDIFFTRHFLRLRKLFWWIYFFKIKLLIHVSFLKTTNTFPPGLLYTQFSVFKEAAKLYFVHFSCVDIIIFDTDLYKTAFSVYSCKKLLFILTVFYVSRLFCFELDFIFVDFLCNIFEIIVYYQGTLGLKFWRYSIDCRSQISCPSSNQPLQL